MPRKENLKKVMVIGSGPIIIGQAAEFDYAGSQACRSLKEDGLDVVLVNSNPATIMTDTNIADRVYIEPLTVDFLAEIRGLAGEYHHLNSRLYPHWKFWHCLDLRYRLVLLRSRLHLFQQCYLPLRGTCRSSCCPDRCR